MTNIAFLIPGDLSLPTGGYAYDRAVIRLLPGQGVTAMHVALPGDFPNPTAEDLADCAAIVRGLPTECLLLIDGLAYGAMPAELIRGFNRPVVALCHHPLALENGISAERAQALHRSEAEALDLAHHVIVTSSLTGKSSRAISAFPPARSRSLNPERPGSRAPPARAMRRWTCWRSARSCRARATACWSRPSPASRSATGS
jgi:hypothetical protein